MAKSVEDTLKLIPAENVKTGGDVPWFDVDAQQEPFRVELEGAREVEWRHEPVTLDLLQGGRINEPSELENECLHLVPRETECIGSGSTSLISRPGADLLEQARIRHARDRRRQAEARAERGFSFAPHLQPGQVHDVGSRDQRRRLLLVYVRSHGQAFNEFGRLGDRLFEVRLADRS
jgi:hypothetical protein